MLVRYRNLCWEVLDYLCLRSTAGIRVTCRLGMRYQVSVQRIFYQRIQLSRLGWLSCALRAYAYHIAASFSLVPRSKRSHAEINRRIVSKKWENLQRSCVLAGVSRLRGWESQWKDRSYHLNPASYPQVGVTPMSDTSNRAFCVLNDATFDTCLLREM